MMEARPWPRWPLVALFNEGLIGATLASERLVRNPPPLPMAEQRAGRVLVIVPMRNEAAHAQGCVEALLPAVARYGDGALLVVDDGSSDATPAILAALKGTHPLREHLHLLRLDEALPPGWFGKPRACWAAAQSPLAQGATWLLFVDADARATPALVGRLVAAAVQQDVALVSLFPYQVLGGIAERLVMPHLFYVLAVGFPWRAVNDPHNPLAIANGQCILVRRRAYEAVGGHAAVRHAIAEDQALAERLKRAGHALWLGDGRDAMRVRMYSSLAALWEGWSKNAYLGLGDRAWLLLVASFFGLAGGVWPWVAWLPALRARRGREAAAWLATLIVVGRNRERAMRELDVPRAYALSTPIGALLCCGIALTAWWRVVSGQGVTWKGRRYAARG